MIFQNLQAKIAEERDHPAHDDADAFVCVLMSHGNIDGFFRTSDWDEEENMTNPNAARLHTNKDLIALFDGENWTKMIGKPKVFLFVMCRGGRLHMIRSTISA